MNEALRDMYRDELTHHLSVLGIDAVMAERGQVQEKIRSGLRIRLACHPQEHSSSLSIVVLRCPSCT